MVGVFVHPAVLLYVFQNSLGPLCRFQIENAHTTLLNVGQSSDSFAYTYTADLNPGGFKVRLILRVTAVLFLMQVHIPMITQLHCGMPNKFSHTLSLTASMTDI